MDWELDQTASERIGALSEPAGRTTQDLSREVAEALAEVFDRAGPPGRDPGWIAFAEAVKSVRPQPRRKTAVLAPVVAGLALALVGLAGGAYLARSSGEAGRHPAPLAMLANIPLPSPPSPAAITAPSQIASPPPPASAPAIAPAVAAPLVADLRPIQAPDPAPTGHLVREARREPRASVPQPADAAARVRSLAAGCEGRGVCGLQSVNHADEIVAAAYARASRSRSADPKLADIRRRLDDLRNDSADPPEILVGNYATLAQDLDRIARAAAPASRLRRTDLAEQEDPGHRQER